MTFDGIETQEQFDDWTGTEDGEHFLDSDFAYGMFDLDFGSTPKWNEALYSGAWFGVPYWIEEYSNGANMCEYVNHMYTMGIEIGHIEEHDGTQYKLVETQPCQEEQEIQLPNGELVYYYRGTSYLRIWEPIA
jgi:hypothetical protein